MSEKNLLVELINADKKNFERPSIKVELPRFSKMLGGKFIVTIKTLPTKLTEEIQNECIKINEKGKPDIDMSKLVNKTLLDSVYYEDDFLFRNKDLMASFNAKIPYDLMDKMLLSSEKDGLYKKYTEIANPDVESLIKEIKK